MSNRKLVQNMVMQKKRACFSGHGVKCHAMSKLLGHVEILPMSKMPAICKKLAMCEILSMCTIEKNQKFI